MPLTIHAADYGVTGDGATDNRNALENALADAVTAAGDGKAKEVVIQLPPGRIAITSPLAETYTTPTYPGNPGPRSMGRTLGIGLPVNLYGRIVWQGATTPDQNNDDPKQNQTTFVLTNNARNLFWIRQHKLDDTFQNFHFNDFSVDFSAVTQKASGHAIIGNRPANGTFQTRLNFLNLKHRRLRLHGVRLDENRETTSIIGIIYLGQHHTNVGGRQAEWRAGETPGTLPLKPFDRDTAAQDGWTYALNIEFVDCLIEEARGGLQVNVLIGDSTTHYVDRILFKNCAHTKTKYLRNDRATSFYCSGLGAQDWVKLINCTSENVSDDAIEFGGGQHYYITNCRAINPRLVGIYLRTWLTPIDPDNCTLTIDGYTQEVNEQAFSADSALVRATPLQVDFIEEGGVSGEGGRQLPVDLRRLDVTGLHTTMTGGKISQIVSRAAGELGLNLECAARTVTLTDCSATLDRMVFDRDPRVSLIAIKPHAQAPGVVAETTATRMAGRVVSARPGGKRPPITGITTGGGGDIQVSDSALDLRGVPQGVGGRADLAVIDSDAVQSVRVTGVVGTVDGESAQAVADRRDVTVVGDQRDRVIVADSGWRY